MARASFLYYLFSKAKRPLYEDPSGHILEGDPGNFTTSDGRNAKLKMSPFGWKDTLIKYARNVKYMGLFRDFTVPMQFVGDGAKILRNRVWIYGMECICYLGILRMDRLNLPYGYKKYYLSEIDFSKFERTETGVTVAATNGGLAKIFKANESTAYTIDIDADDEHVIVHMDGREFDFNATYGVIPDQAIKGTANFYLGMTTTSQEGATAEVSFFDIAPTQSSAYPNGDYFNETLNRPQTYRIHGKIQIFFDKNVPFELRIETNDGTTGGFPQYSLVNIAGSPRPAGSTEWFTFDQTITVPAGDRINMKIYGGNPVDATTQFTVKDGEILVDYVYRHPETWVSAHYAYRVGELLVRAMTGGQYGFKSDWLHAKKDLVYTSGDALRLLPGAQMKTSLGDFFQALKEYQVGLGIEDDKLVIEPLSYFFRANKAASLGTVSNWKVTIAEDLLANTIKTGQKENTYTDVNGRFEVNQGQQWTLPITRVVREFNLLSPYRKDPLGIELLRINYEQKTTTDTSSDNDIFQLSIETNPTPVDATVTFIAADQTMVAPRGLKLWPGQIINVTGTASNNGQLTIDTVTRSAGSQIAHFTTAVVDEVNTTATLEYVNHKTYNLYRPAYTTITGVAHPGSLFNVELSPKRGILRNGALLRSMIYPQDTEIIKFQSADKNADLSTELAGVVITEKEDIQIGALPDRFFLPYYITFTTAPAINAEALIEADPYALVPFVINGQTFWGYLFDGSVKSATRESQEWKLLSGPNNDLTKL